MTYSDFHLRLGIPESVLRRLVENKDKCYNTYHVPKKSGGQRQIDAPNVELKGVQLWVLRNLLESVELHPAATAFVKKRSIRHNADAHIGKKFILTLDIKDFFPSIVETTVFQVFNKIVDNDELANMLARLCTFRGYLPQGAVTSPTLSNISFRTVDDLISGRAAELGVSYTRYADDMTFSSNVRERLDELGPIVAGYLKDAGYVVNHKKTRLVSSGKALEVTGLYLNSGRPTVGRILKRKVRSLLFRYIYHGDRTVSKSTIYGYLSFIRGIEPDFEASVRAYLQKVRDKKDRRPP